MNQPQYYDKYKRNKQSKQFYNSAAWAKARSLALKRDNYLCTRCLKDKRIRKADVVHHIIEVTDDFTKALELSNLESVCHMHHNRIHKSNSENEHKNIPKKISIVISQVNPEAF